MLSLRYDISRRLTPRTTVWPGSPGFETYTHLSLARGDDANASGLSMDMHAGTHVDAPRHFIEDGATVDLVGLDPFVGEAEVVDLVHAEVIDAAELEQAVGSAAPRRLLLKTRNSVRAEYREGPFRRDYVALTRDAADWVAARDLALIGIDYLSIQRFDDPPDTHRTILDADTCILENVDLQHVVAGTYMLVCLPLLVVGAEAAPARAILLTDEA